MSDQAEIHALLKALEKACAVACDCILQFALNPHAEGFRSTDPHVVVGTLARRYIRGEPVSVEEFDLAVEAVNDLPGVDASFWEVLGKGAQRTERLRKRSK